MSGGRRCVVILVGDLRNGFGLLGEFGTLEEPELGHPVVLALAGRIFTRAPVLEVLEISRGGVDESLAGGAVASGAEGFDVATGERGGGGVANRNGQGTYLLGAILADVGDVVQIGVTGRDANAASGGLPQRYEVGGGGGREGRVAQLEGSHDETRSVLCRPALFGEAGEHLPFHSVWDGETARGDVDEDGDCLRGAKGPSTTLWSSNPRNSDEDLESE
jgi:hypothetical protein